jgi:hypothetical protein
MCNTEVVDQLADNILGRLNISAALVDLRAMRQSRQAEP